ncbi:hypothetical protein PR048_021193 [Dryococelus australis]|uniref:F5/8 type C domain-containing protein n=1 Tax=Dryococelus australis TaxID=614101 RepID=A0ABQ9GXJ9_9NEOP|nr:hypothetical protein PR048_021193 [Dryococelus australis]
MCRSRLVRHRSGLREDLGSNPGVRTENHGGAWCPKQQITTEPKEWLEIDLHSVHMVAATETQGRFGNGQGQEFAEAYLLEYWRPRLGKWVRYRDIKGQELMSRQQVLTGKVAFRSRKMGKFASSRRKR